MTFLKNRKVLINFLLLTSGYVLFFGLARAAFFLAFGGGAAGPELATAFLQGARLDLSLAATLALPVYFLLAFLRLARVPQKPVLIVAGAWYGLLNSAFMFLLAAEFPFYRQYSSKLNHLFFEYLSNPHELVVTVSGIVNLWLVLPVIFLLVALTVYATMRINRTIFAFGSESAPSRAVSLALVAGLTVVFIRGGFQRRPVNWDSAFFSKSNIMNQTALNGPYNLFQHFQIYLEEKKKNVPVKKYFEDDRALAILRAGLKEDKTEPLIKPDGRKPNIVIITLESFSGSHCGVLGAKDSLTPNFDKLSGEGLLFTNFYANGTRTSRALTSVLCGFPPLPGVNLTKKIQAQQDMPSIAKYLAQAGYRNLFFYSGDRHFEDMSGFFLKAGFDYFYDFSDFTGIRYKNPIGVYDEDLFANADRILSETKQPFLAEIMTLTNHGPFTLPDYYQARPDLPKELRTFVYTDDVLARFMETVKKSPFYKNTIFFITADHAAHEHRFNRDRFRIPLLVISPLLKKPGVETRVFSQIDLPSTILRLCGIDVKDADTPFWGKPLGQSTGMAYVLDDPYFGVLTDKYLFRETIDGEQGFLLDDEGREVKVDSSAFADYARATLQMSRKLFFGGKAGASWKKENFRMEN
ncbi:MAG: LTA synthase family protein [Elusimicrobiaceae bacterium]